MTQEEGGALVTLKKAKKKLMKKQAAAEKLGVSTTGAAVAGATEGGGGQVGDSRFEGPAIAAANRREDRTTSCGDRVMRVRLRSSRSSLWLLNASISAF